MAAVTSWKCEVCGYVHVGTQPPEICPICGVDSSLFSPLQQASSEPAPLAWRCNVCGYVHHGPQPPDICPVCGVDSSFFEPTSTPTPTSQTTPSDAAATPAHESERIVVIGGGIAGLTAALKARRISPDALIWLVYQEPELPYYRLNLTRFLAGQITEAELSLHPASFFADNNITVVHACAVSIDRIARSVRLQYMQYKDGTEHTANNTGQNDSTLGYERLVLATGSHPFLPPIPGVIMQIPAQKPGQEQRLEAPSSSMHRSGVYSLRTLDDAREIRKLAAGKGRCVVVGGGLLGLETAGALQTHGCQVTVIEGFEWLLPRQLAKPAAQMLQKHLQSLGIRVLCSSRVQRLVSDRQVDGNADGNDNTLPVTHVVLQDGTELPVDFVVLATGVRPNASLARDCGLEVNRAVVVNDYMETSDPRIFAAGDVAEHHEGVPGIWPVALAQGAIAGANAAGARERYLGVPRTSQLKVLDITILSIGHFEAPDASYEVLEDATDNRYVRVVARDNKLVGANLFGDTTIASTLATMLRQTVESGEDIRTLEALREALPMLNSLQFTN